MSSCAQNLTGNIRTTIIGVTCCTRCWHYIFIFISESTTGMIQFPRFTKTCQEIFLINDPPLWFLLSLTWQSNFRGSFSCPNKDKMLFQFSNRPHLLQHLLSNQHWWHPTHWSLIITQIRCKPKHKEKKWITVQNHEWQISVENVS